MTRYCRAKHLISVCLEDISEELGNPLVRARSHWQGHQIIQFRAKSDASALGA